MNESTGSAPNTWGTLVGVIGGAALGYWAGKSSDRGFGPGVPYGVGYPMMGCGCNGRSDAGIQHEYYNHGNVEGQIAEIRNTQAYFANQMTAQNTNDSIYDGFVRVISGQNAIAANQADNRFADAMALNDRLCAMEKQIANESAATRELVNRLDAENWKTRAIQAENKAELTPLQVALTSLTGKVDCLGSAFTGCAVRSVPACPGTSCGCSASLA